jgi:hypothetical protein
MRTPDNGLLATAVTAAALCCACMLALGVSIAAAQPPQTGTFITDAATGCQVWNPNPQRNETVRWQGPCVNGLAQGKGRLQWLHNGMLYETDEGEWNAGRQSGHGTQQWPLGRYDGDIVDGEPSGEGTLVMKDSRYDGEFRNGKPDGVGTVTSRYGVFSGTWKDGCFVSEKRRMGVGVSSSACP